jgi:hypothetical protein
MRIGCVIENAEWVIKLPSARVFPSSWNVTDFGVSRCFSIPLFRPGDFPVDWFVFRAIVLEFFHKPVEFSLDPSTDRFIDSLENFQIPFPTVGTITRVNVVTVFPATTYTVLVSAETGSFLTGGPFVLDFWFFLRL